MDLTLHLETYIRVGIFLTALCAVTKQNKQRWLPVPFSSSTSIRQIFFKQILENETMFRFWVRLALCVNNVQTSLGTRSFQKLPVALGSVIPP
jgi:hypothetical protein